MDKNIFDMLTENAINERLDNILLQDSEYKKAQKKIDNLMARFENLKLSKEQRLIIDRLISSHIEIGYCYGWVTYQQGIKDCAFLLREMELKYEKVYGGYVMNINERRLPMQNRGRRNNELRYYNSYKDWNDYLPRLCQLLESNEQVMRKLSENTAKTDIPLWEKRLLTLEEASALFGIGVNRLRKMSDDENCSFVLWNQSRRLIKREELEKYLVKAYSI